MAQETLLFVSKAKLPRAITGYDHLMDVRDALRADAETQNSDLADRIEFAVQSLGAIAAGSSDSCAQDAARAALYMLSTGQGGDDARHLFSHGS